MVRNATLKLMKQPVHVYNGYLMVNVAVSKIFDMQFTVAVDICSNCAGSLTVLPKFTPASVTRFLKTDAQAYTDLAAAYTSKKQEDLPSAIEKHQSQFVEVGSNVPGLLC